MNPIILITAALFGAIATVGTVWHAQRHDITHPIRWSGIVGLTCFLSPIVVDEVASYVVLQVSDVFHPLYYHIAVIGIAFAIGAVAIRQYRRTATPV